MKVLKIKKGKWKNGTVPRHLIFETCPNAGCSTGELHYPDYMTGPHCPDCKRTLIGSDLVKLAGRVYYHVEA